MDDSSRNELKPGWKKHLAPMIIGSILGFGGFYIAVTEYGACIYYLWILILPLFVIISLPIRSQLSLRVYLTRFCIIAVTASALTGLGLGVLLVKKNQPAGTLTR